MPDLEYWRNLGHLHASQSKDHRLFSMTGNDDKHACNVAYLTAYYSTRGQLDGAAHTYNKPMGTFWGFTSEEGDAFKEAYDAGWKQGQSGRQRQPAEDRWGFWPWNGARRLLSLILPSRPF
jgi:hypothetical protein